MTAGIIAGQARTKEKEFGEARSRASFRQVTSPGQKQPMWGTEGCLRGGINLEDRKKGLFLCVCVVLCVKFG